MTTPAYSTAITVVDYERLPYGGAELARLFDGEMRPAGGIGGRHPAAFGMVARKVGTGHRVQTQRGRPRANLEHPPLRLPSVPRPKAYPRRPYAGPFRRLEAVAVTRDPALTITTRHVFRADAIETHWTVEPRRAARGRWSIDVLFPSTGSEAYVDAELEDGTLERLGERRLGDVRRLHVHSRESGYVIEPLTRAPGRLRLLHPAPQDSAPEPGPTLAIALLSARPLRPLSFAVRISL